MEEYLYFYKDFRKLRSKTEKQVEKKIKPRTSTRACTYRCAHTGLDIHNYCKKDVSILLGFQMAALVSKRCFLGLLPTVKTVVPSN